jgi:hypothetical protein
MRVLTRPIRLAFILEWLGFRRRIAGVIELGSRWKRCFPTLLSGSNAAIATIRQQDPTRIPLAEDEWLILV